LRQAALIALGFVIALVAGDRLLARVKLPRVYGSTNECRWKCDLYDAVPQPPDVVFIGSSYEFYGISPRVVDAEAGRLLGREVTSFNLASSAASLLTESFTVRRMLESGRVPQVAYLGVSPRGASTTRREWLTWGMRGLGDARDLPLTLTVDSEMLWEVFRMTAFRSNFQFHDMRLITQYTLMGAPFVPDMKTEHDDRGWARWIGGDKRDLPAWDIVRSRHTSGVDGPAYAPDNINGRAIRRAIADLQEAGIIVRMLEMPTASSSAPPDSDTQRADYEAFLQALSADTGLVILRTPRNLVPDERFFDHLHLDPEGAEVFSRWLAADVATVLRDKPDAPRP
jgi:hypothetical protein